LAELKPGSLIQSPRFTFVVGQEGKPIVVHAAAIAATSQQLDALINGGMKESEERCARFDNVQVDDFIRFCEYAYRGDYTVPPWRKSMKDKRGGKAVPEPEPISGVEPPPEDLNYVQQSQVYDEPELEVACETQYAIRPISRTTLRTQFNSRNYLNDGDPKALIMQHFEPKSNSAVEQNFTPVFLAHARLYCFAHLRMIEPLKALTLAKLHKTLMNFKLYTKRVRDIIELARYVYSNPDLPESDEDTLDDMRKLVVEYIVCEIDTIGKCGNFVNFMEEGGEFVGDFWRIARDCIA
jgi:hypothetical protein